MTFVDTFLMWCKRIVLLIIGATIGWWLIKHPEIFVAIFTAVVTFGKVVGQAITTVLSGLFS